MTLRTMCVLAALTLTGTLSLAGCQGDPADGTATPAPTTEVAPPTQPAATSNARPANDLATTTAPPELSAEEQDLADIEKTLQAFDDALVRALTEEESIEGIYPFARDTAREQWVTQVMAYDAQEVRFRGLTDLEVQDIAIEADIAEAVACRDVSDLEAVNADGESIITDDRLDQALQDFLLERDDSAEFGWYVVSDVSRNEPCDG